MARSDPYQLMYRTQFDMFAGLAFEVLHPGEQLLENWHIGVIAHQITQFIAGTPNRLIINLPPRSLKSFMTSIAMPAFLLGKDPRLKILILAGTSDLANDFRQKVVRLMRSDRYGGVFDQIEFTASDRRMDFPQGGSLSFLRYGEAIIGKGYDVIIIDDPQSPSQIEDADKREQVAEYFKNDVLHRLNSKTHGRIVIVQQRLHVGDLTGYFSHKREWQCLAISAISRGVEKWATPRGGFVTRNKGVALCEERESKQTIEEQLPLMGAEKFAA
ncbi:terminase large subunit domain-containing protein, partial [Devosia sp. A369]